MLTRHWLLLLLLLLLLELNLVNLLCEQAEKKLSRGQGSLQVRERGVEWRIFSSFSHLHWSDKSLLLKRGAGRWGQREREAVGVALLYGNVAPLARLSLHLPQTWRSAQSQRRRWQGCCCSQRSGEKQSYSCFKLFFSFFNWGIIDILVSGVQYYDSIFVYVSKWSPQSV